MNECGGGAGARPGLVLRRAAADGDRAGRAVEIREFTGISAPYEASDKPEIVVDTGKQTRVESVQAIIDFLEVNGCLGARVDAILEGA